MIDLLEVENIDLETNFIEVLFDGMFKEGFYVTTEFDYNVIVEQFEDFDNGVQEHKIPTEISFWDFKTFNAEGEQIKINDRDSQRIKQLVEFKLIDILIDEVNNH